MNMKKVLSVIMCITVLFTAMSMPVFADTSNRVNTANVKYFEDFEGIDNLSQAGFNSAKNTDNSGNYRFLLGDANSNGKGIETNTNANLAVSGPTGNYAFKLDADHFENAGKALEASYDLYIPSVTQSTQAPCYITFNGENNTTLQCVAKFPGLTTSAIKVSEEVTNYKAIMQILTGTSYKTDWNDGNGNGLWGANSATGNISTKSKDFDTSSAGWVNLKIRLFYSKDGDGNGYYTTQYYINNKLVCDASGNPMSFLLQQKEEPSKRESVQFMLYAYNGVNATDKLVFDNLSMRVIDANPVTDPDAEYSENFEGISSLADAGFTIDSDKFELGNAKDNGYGMVVTSATSTSVNGPKGTSAFKLSADKFENAGKALEASYDLYIPAGTEDKKGTNVYITFMDQNGGTVQCVSLFPKLTVNNGVLKYQILDGTSYKSDWKTNGDGLWGANAPQGTIGGVYVNHAHSEGAWVNFKIRMTYVKDAEGNGYYVTQYYVDNELLCDKNGEAYTFTLQQKEDPSKRQSVEFMIYAGSGINAAEKLIFDNLSIKLIDVAPKITATVKGGSVVYSYNNTTANDISYQAIIAKYDDNGKVLADAKFGVNGTMKAGRFGNIEQSLASLEEGEKYKVFLWDDTDSISPLTSAVEVKVPSKFESASWITAPNTYSSSDNKYEKGATDNAMYRADSITMWDDTLGDTIGAYETWKEFTGLKMGAAPILRKTFDTKDKAIEKATVQVTGLGYYEVYMNGEKLGEKILEPFTTLYDEDCVYYSEYDVTDKLVKGTGNGVGAVLGRGTYNISIDNVLGMAAIKSGVTKSYGKQRFKMSLVIEYADGTADYIPTDTTWKASWSPIRYDQQAFGEFYDARMEDSLLWSTNGWTKGDFDDSSWANAELETAKDPKGELAPAPLNYNKVIQTYNNMDVTDMGNNTFRVDVGRVLTGWASLNIPNGVEGEKISMHYIENLNTWNVDARDRQSNKFAKFYYKDKDGVEQSIETYAQTDHYVMKSGQNNWKPKFTLKSFRYIDVTFPEGMNVSADDVKAMVSVEEVHANLEETGTFTSSNEIFNKTYDLGKKTLLNNMHSYISDTPLHENAPYLIDGVLSAEWGIYTFDAENYLRKWLRDMRATQDGPDDEKPGRLNAIAPVASLSMAGPEWSEGFAELTWALYQNTGKKEIIEENYDNLKLLLQWETSEARKAEAESAASGKLVNGSLPDYIYDSTWGDHVPPSQIKINGSTLSEKRFYTLTATAFVYREAVLLSEMAKALGKTSDAAKFTNLANNIKNAFNENFWDEEKGYYHDAKVYKTTQGGTNEFRQTPQIIAIKFGLADESKKAGLLTKLQENIDLIQANGYSGFSTGVIGTKYIFDVLTENGMVDELYQMFNTNLYPGYGYWLENGATSMWEYWEVGKRSDNHHMFSAINKWFFRYLAGIQEKTAGYKETVIKPYIPGDMNQASASIDTKFGEISSAWSVDEIGAVTLTVTVPDKVTATVYVPLKGNTSVVAPANATASQITEEGYSVYEVKGGTYTFTATK